MENAPFIFWMCLQRNNMQVISSLPLFEMRKRKAEKAGKPFSIDILREIL